MKLKGVYFVRKIIEIYAVFSYYVFLQTFTRHDISILDKWVSWQENEIRGLLLWHSE